MAILLITERHSLDSLWLFNARECLPRSSEHLPLALIQTASWPRCCAPRQWQARADGPLSCNASAFIHCGIMSAIEVREALRDDGSAQTTRVSDVRTSRGPLSMSSLPAPLPPCTPLVQDTILAHPGSDRCAAWQIAAGVLVKFVNLGKGWRSRLFVLKHGVLRYYRVRAAQASPSIVCKVLRKISRSRAHSAAWHAAGLRHVQSGCATAF